MSKHRSIEELVAETTKTKLQNKELLKELRARLRELAMTTRLYVSVKIRGTSLNLITGNYWDDNQKRRGGSSSVSTWGVRVGPFPIEGRSYGLPGTNHYYTLSEPDIMRDEELMLRVVATLPNLLRKWNTGIQRKNNRLATANKTIGEATNQLESILVIQHAQTVESNGTYKSLGI